MKNSFEVISNGYNAIIFEGKEYRIVAGDKTNLMVSNETERMKKVEISKVEKFLTIVK